MQVRSERQRHGRLGSAVYRDHPSQDWPTKISRAPASNTRDNLSNNSTQWFLGCCFELRGTNPSTLLFFCFFAPHRQPVAVHSVALYSSLVSQQSLLICLAPAPSQCLLISWRVPSSAWTAPATICTIAVPAATCHAARALQQLPPGLLQLLPAVLVAMLPMLLMLLLLLPPLPQTLLCLPLLLPGGPPVSYTHLTLPTKRIV